MSADEFNSVKYRKNVKNPAYYALGLKKKEMLRDIKYMF